MTACTLALQSRRLAVSLWITGPSSICAPREPDTRVWSSACTTTVARSGSASLAMLADASEISASARRASAWWAPRSPGILGIRSAIRSSARATVAPSTAGSSACNPNRSPSSKYHHETERARSASTASSTGPAASRSALRRTAAQETFLAHSNSRVSVSAVANRVSSTTLSMPSSPSEKAAAVRGRSSSAWAAAIHLRAFH